ncbi:MAG: nitroreductase family protein [Thermodesulfobacteriota bacterium]|nr:nitroreductase family protein [Thermodesulfobacteriota bacterium]
MKSPVTTRIDAEQCNGCGLCVQVCPSEILAIQENKAVVTGGYCLDCGHCEAVCPTGAVNVAALAGEAEFATFSVDDRWLPFGAFDTGELVRLMRSRRSCRNYTDQPVDRAQLSDLVRIGITAPSGTNSQGWTFSILAQRNDVVALGNRAALFFKRLNHLAESSLLRFLVKIFKKDRLGRYYRNYYKTVRHGLEQWEREGRDTLFHGATAAILVGGKAGASCPAEDALLATQNILLGAHAMGLGSCLIGFVVEAVRHDPTLRKFLEIPADEEIYSVIALGYPAEFYQKAAGRKEVTPRVLGLSS